jgi:hypothetical protein
VPGSDRDLLVILRESEESFLKRIPRFLPSRFPVGVDVFPYTYRDGGGKDEGGREFLYKKSFRRRCGVILILRLIGMHNACSLKLLVTEQDQIISDSNDFGHPFGEFFH